MTLPISLVMFTHWFSRRTGGQEFEALDSPRVALFLTSGLLLLSWLAFWVWERPYSSAFYSLGHGPGPNPPPMLGWGHPRILSYILSLAPGSLYIAERVGKYISAFLNETTAS